MMRKTTKMVKKGWSRGDGRGILTPLERQKLENGTVDRHSRYNIEVKTRKAIDDLTLIFSSHIEPFIDFAYPINLNALDSYIQDLILIQFRCHNHRLRLERKEKGVKRKVQSKDVWKIVNKTLKDAKKNIRDREQGYTTITMADSLQLTNMLTKNRGVDAFYRMWSKGSL